MYNSIISLIYFHCAVHTSNPAVIIRLILFPYISLKSRICLIWCRGTSKLFANLFQQLEMTTEPDSFFTTHAKSSFDPALFSSLFYGGNFPDETAGKIFDWLIKQFHDIFNDGMNLSL